MPEVIQCAKIDFSFFDSIRCINLSDRRDRWIEACSEFESIGISGRVERFEAIKNDIGWKGLLDSFISLIRDAKKRNLRNILILEDDITFLERDPLYFEGVVNSIKELQDFHLFYLSANTNGRMKTKNDSLCIAKDCLSTHAVCYNHSIYDRILEDYDRMGYGMGFIDVYLKDNIQPMGKSFVSRKLLATQKSGYSDIEGKNVNYDFIVNKFNSNVSRRRRGRHRR